MKFTLGLPPKGCWPNDRVHYMARARAVKAYREEARIMCSVHALCGGCVARWRAARVQATFHFRRKPWRDTDSCLSSLKAVFDGLQDAGVLANDRDLIHLPVIRCAAPKGSRGFVVVEVEEIREVLGDCVDRADGPTSTDLAIGRKP